MTPRHGMAVVITSYSIHYTKLYEYKVITDYRHDYRINPTITSVQVPPSGRDDVVRVRNLSEQCVGPFCFDIAWTGDIVANRERDLQADDFRKSFGRRG